MENLNILDNKKVENVGKSAYDLVASSTAKASAIAAVPIPLLDIGGVIFVQMDMVKKLAMMYDVDPDNQQKLLLVTFLTSIGGALVSEAVSSITTATQLEKILSESLIKASVAGLITTITGEVYQLHFEKGGSLNDINLDNYIHYVREQIQSDRISAEVLGAKAIDSVLGKFGM